MELSLLRPLLKNNAALLVQYGAAAAVPLVLVPHLARNVGVSAFGTLAVLLAWATYASTLVHYAFHLTAPVRAAHQPGEVPRLLATVLQARSVLLAGSLCALAIIVAAGVLPPFDSATGLVILVAMPVAAALETTWHLQVSDRYALAAAISVAGTALALWFGFGLVNDPGSLAWGAAALAATSITIGVGSLAVSLRLVGHLPVASGSDVRTALREGRALFGATLIAATYAGLGPILIGWLGGLAEAGRYAVLARIATAVCSGAELMHTAAYPALTRLYVSDRAGYLGLVRWLVGIYIVLASAMCLVGWELRTPVLHYMYGAADAELEQLYALGLLWTWCGIFGSVLVGYFAASGQPEKAYRLLLLVLAVTVAVGVPGAMLVGARGWLAGLLCGQGVIVASAFIHWRKVRGDAGAEGIA